MKYLKPFMIMLLIILIAASCGCQKTPSDEIIVNKLNSEYVVCDGFEEMDIPDHFMLPVANKGNAFVSFQAKVEPSTATGYPVLHVKPGVFSIDQILNMTKVLLPAEAKIYESWDRTKEEYLWLMAQANQLDAENNDDVKMYLDWLTEASESALPSVEKKLANIAEALPEANSSYYAEVPGKRTVSSISFVRDGTSITYFRDKEYLYTPFDWIEDDMPYEKPDPKLSEGEAEEAALQMLRLLGIDFPISAVSAEPVVIHRLPKTEWSGWLFHFTRTYSGIDTIFDESGLLVWSSAPSIGAPWGREMIRIVMDEHGVFCFEWSYPLKSVAVAAENIEMISLEEAVNRAQQQLLYMYAATTLERLNVTVEKAELMMGVLSIRNQKELGQAVPIWKFTYTLDTGTPDSKSTPYYICISTLDGSYVDPIITTQDIEDAAQRQQE